MTSPEEPPANGDLSPKHENGQIKQATSLVRLKKEINFFTGCAIIIGNIVGSGIFITSKGVLEKSGSPGLALVIWTASGLISLIGAYCYTELGTLIQTSGGDYAYINESYGRLMSFLYTYLMVFVTFPCINAIFGITVAVYIVKLFFHGCDAPELLVKLISALTISLLCVINMSHVKLVSKMQAAFTITKLASLLIIIFLGFYHFYVGNTNTQQVIHEWFFKYPVDSSGLAMAFYNGLFTYSGWNCLNFLTEEMKNPSKNLPRALIVSIPFITFIYLVTNIAYFLVLSPKEVLESEAVALTFSEKTLGSLSWVTPLFIAFSTFGALSGNIMGASRVYYAAGRDGNLPQCFALISIKSFNPITCIILQTAVSMVMLAIENLDTLILFGTLSELIFIAISLSSIFYFRRTRPDAHRPIKVNLIFPVLFLIVCLFLMIITAKQNPVESLIGALILVAGVPVYWIGFKWKKPRSMNKFLGSTIFYCVSIFTSVMIILSGVYRTLVGTGERVLPLGFKKFIKWDHPAGPKTIHFWAPFMKWGLVAAGIGDMARPADKLSKNQTISLLATGTIWSRYSMVIKPKNYTLFFVNAFLAMVACVQLTRIYLYEQEVAKRGQQAVPVASQPDSKQA